MKQQTSDSLVQRAIAQRSCGNTALFLAVSAILLISGCAQNNTTPPWLRKSQPTSEAPVSSGRDVTALPATITVQRGETVYALSRRYGVSVKDIIAANGMEPPYMLQAGGRVTIPKPGQAPPPRSTAPAPVSVASAPPPEPVKSEPAKEQPPTPAPPPETQAAPPPAPAEPASPAAPPPVQTASAQTSPASRVTKLPSPPGRAGKLFGWPVQGKVISGYGPSDNGTRNDGINIAVLQGASVRAAENGVVVYAGSELKGFGNLLLIKHDGGWMTAYAHNDSLEVEKGQVVKKGQVIAKAGQTGNVSTPQLHFEVRKGSGPVNPLDYMEKSTSK